MIEDIFPYYITVIEQSVCECTLDTDLNAWFVHNKDVFQLRYKTNFDAKHQRTPRMILKHDLKEADAVQYI